MSETLNKTQPKGYGIVTQDAMTDRRLTREAKCIYAYLCAFAGTERIAYPTRDKILYDLDMSETAYYKHLKLLKECEYIKVEQTKGESGQFARNYYVLTEFNPKKSEKGKLKKVRCKEVDNITEFIQSQPLAQPYTTSRGTVKPSTAKEGNIINSITNNNFNNIMIKESEPAPAKNTYGKFNNVRLTQSEHDELMATYGKDKTLYYIDRVDRQIETKGFYSKNHYCTIEEWIIKDKPEKDKPENKPQPVNRNRFANFKQREWDEEQLKQLETLYLREY